jgi:hypothetical protein
LDFKNVMICIFEYEAFEITWKSIGIKKKELLGGLTWNSVPQLILPGHHPNWLEAHVETSEHPEPACAQRWTAATTPCRPSCPPAASHVLDAML